MDIAGGIGVRIHSFAPRVDTNALYAFTQNASTSSFSLSDDLSDFIITNARSSSTDTRRSKERDTMLGCFAFCLALMTEDRSALSTPKVTLDATSSLDPAMSHCNATSPTSTVHTA
jgi:hypothetical protein